MCAQVSEAYISRLDMIPDIDAQHLSVTVQGNKQALGMPVRVAAIEDGKRVTPSQTCTCDLFWIACHACATSALAAQTPATNFPTKKLTLCLFA